ncbi:hypothetical protein DVH24_033990 [Malus domestica]|uniref:Uncharacterized protein n=1 Tax=Malus domestica TaxID=3750 RepID=A0A498KWS3_MALDO|nr:hypothetical protein DVH24_033990 [Malus domestica]
MDNPFRHVKKNHETFWELTGFELHRNSEVKQVWARAYTPRMGDPLGSSRVSSQKQKSEGVVEAQSGQYRAMVESSPGCGGSPGRDVSVWYQSISLGSIVFITRV